MWRPAEPDATSSGPAVDRSVPMTGRRCCTPCASWGHGAIGHGPFRVRRLVGVSQDWRLRRGAELMIGVAAGIAVAEPLIGALSPGSWADRRARRDAAARAAPPRIAAVHADYALRNTRVLARRALAAPREGDVPSPALPEWRSRSSSVSSSPRTSNKVAGSVLAAPCTVKAPISRGMSGQ